MSETKFEPVTEAELAQLRELHEAALTTRGWSAGVVAFEKYRAHALDLAPRMAAHLGALMFAGKAVECMWEADEIGSIPLADSFALCGNMPDGMTLVSTTELARLRNVDFELKQARRDERRMSEHS